MSNFNRVEKILGAKIYANFRYKDNGNEISVPFIQLIRQHCVIENGSTKSYRFDCIDGFIYSWDILTKKWVKLEIKNDTTQRQLLTLFIEHINSLNSYSYN